MKMNIQSATFVMLAAASCLVMGCGKKAGTKGVGESQKIQITGNDQMQYNLTEFTAKAGSQVVISFKNIGQNPKQTMGHDLVILAKGTDPLAFANAGIVHPENGFMDPGAQGKVLASTKILGPGEEEALTFSAPSESGDYPFVCTFPGHAAAGMKGAMHVQ